jgi:hypothetical protein
MTHVLSGHGNGLPVYGKILSLEIIKVTHDMIMLPQDVIKVPHDMVSIYPYMTWF